MALVEEFIRILNSMKKKGTNNFTSSYLVDRLSAINRLFTDVRTLHVRIACKLGQKEFEASAYTQQGVYSKALAAFEAAENYILEHSQRLSGTKPNVGQLEENGCSSSIKLPRIELPKFNGDYTAWASFFDTFKSLVHDNMSIPPIQKFHYLKSCLTGEAGSIIQTLAVTSDNYVSAWETLTSRYTIKRVITSSLINRFMSISNASSKNTASIKTLRDVSATTIDALKNLGYKVSTWDPILIHLLSTKLDTSLRLDWERCISSSPDYPSFSTFSEFIGNQILMLESIGTEKQKPEKPVPGKNIKVHNSAVDKNNCVLCQQDHVLIRCDQFLKLEPASRLKIDQAKQLCRNCLRPGHETNSCFSKNRCKNCSKKHHSLIHLNTKNQTKVTDQSPNNDEPTPSSVVAHLSIKDPRSVLLGTFFAMATSQNGNKTLIRGLIDSGSETSFISENLTQLLLLKRQKVAATIYGVTGKSTHSVSSEVTIQLHSPINIQEAITVTALILPKITDYVPQTYSSEQFPQLNKLDLADAYALSRAPIDVLIGADYYPQLFKGATLKSSDGTLMALDSPFGWVVSGILPKSTRSHSLSTHHCCNVDKALQAFWQVEEIPIANPVSEEDDYCENLFTNTVTQASSGQFIVALPFKSSKSKASIGPSKDIAEAALKRICRRFDKHPNLKEDYSKFMLEYESLGHMSPIAKSEDLVYLPHHPVLKTENGKPKIRVVFNASAKTKSGNSLNDILLIGPKLQLDITTILINWRNFQFVGVADIVKMFRQILVRKEDRRFQNIFWLSKSGDFQTYQLNTVTYGTGPAPFLASRVIRELAMKYGSDFPDAQRVLLQSTYVDDILFGANTTAQLSSIKEQLIQLLAKGRFELSKWAFNTSINNEIPEVEVENRVFQGEKSEDNKILGIAWNTASDFFQFFITPSSFDSLTKRILLSENAKIYDPMGWISPTTILLRGCVEH
ncbi:uncharacterized protein [Prorops nasuta]|uniref:uncharacterized protein n=1 Tax=Prorops nasuta TaxID=863751 RepID=UPI0034CED999